VAEPTQNLDAISSLDDATRRALYQHVAAAREPVTREAAAAAVGVDRSVAAYHLDKLVAEGLLAASFARPAGRSGPGAGRPAKRYVRAESEVSVTLPPRSYEMLAELFAAAIERDDTGRTREAVSDAASTLGATLAAGETDVVTVLENQGFEPFEDGDVVRLGNCPFHQLAQRHTELVCGINLSLMSALTQACAAEGLAPRLDPAPGRCCVAFVPT
jgi:predicted ArsR family transcriptional regulator